MGTVFVNIALSLDGYMAPEGMDLQHWGDPQYLQWGAKWGSLMGWVIGLQAFREKLKFGPGGETGPVNDAFQHTMQRSGANIMGQRMFEQGEVSWPEEAPFQTPVFVLTKNVRQPWVRPGGTTFYFVNDGPERALELARAAAGNRDIRISGGATVIQQYLNLGVVEELEIAHTAVLFGSGRRLFEGVDAAAANFVVDSVLPSSGATHVRYRRA